jgi:hypothetical protein
LEREIMAEEKNVNKDSVLKNIQKTPEKRGYAPPPPPKKPLNDKKK